MRTNKQWLIIALIIFSLVLIGNKGPTRAEASDQQDGNIGYIEDIAFKRMEGKERIAISVSKQPVLKIESQQANTIIMKLENMQLRDNLKHPFSEDQMNIITKVTPLQDTIDGKQMVIIKTDIRQGVPYSVKQEGQSIYLDLNISGISTVRERAATKASASYSDSNEPVVGQNTNNGPAMDPEHKITVDFQGANIKSVLRLLAETGGVNIVSGDDVRGTVTVSMKRIPWIQALDTILKINSLTRKQEGNVITVMTLDRAKRDETARKAAEDEAKKVVQASLIEQGKLRQVNIEAKIVEASEDFVRQLGVQWGVAHTSTIGSTSYGIMAGTNPSVGGTATTLPNNIGLTASNLAFNFPTSIAGGTPGIGFIIGGTKAVLDAQLAALETSSEGKIISSPKITTMDNVKATIKQGEEIPYTTYDSNGHATVSFKEALLKLEVTPKITPEDKISMTITASNDRGNYARVAELNGNVPIIKNEIDSTVVVGNGDTIVIGGVLKTEDTKGVSGVPWLHKIPFLGWLFKTESITKTKRHLLIFVTPKIITENRAEETSKS